MECGQTGWAPLNEQDSVWEASIVETAIGLGEERQLIAGPFEHRLCLSSQNCISPSGNASVITRALQIVR